MNLFKINKLGIIQILLFGFIISACDMKQSNELIVTDVSDYIEYLDISHQIKKLDIIDSQIDFWDLKYNQDDRGFVYLNRMAGLYVKKFRATGEIENVFISDSIYHKMLKITSGRNMTAAYRGLSQNAILKHEFKKALAFADSAINTNPESTSELLMKFDALMELGDSVFSHQMIEAYGQRKDFDFLTRKSKYLDKMGDLDSAILVMEIATDQMKSSNNVPMICWSLANLGDMYMHAGRVQESYDSYLNVLKLDPAYHYALKGIAWLAYSNDKKPKEAIHILNFLENIYKMPDVYLTLAEIHEYMGEKKISLNYYQKFYALASSKQYLGMYNKYKILLNVEQFNNHEEAINLCETELNNRLTSEVYDLMAWTYFNMGEYEEAYEISKKHVIDKSYEPKLMFHTAKILNQRKVFGKAEHYLNEVLASKIEVGPVMYNEILNTFN